MTVEGFYFTSVQQPQMFVKQKDTKSNLTVSLPHSFVMASNHFKLSAESTVSHKATDL